MNPALLGVIASGKQAIGGGPPVTAALIASGANGANEDVYTSDSYTPGANKLILASVLSSVGAGTPETAVLTGNGLTWVSVGTIIDHSTIRRLSLFRAMGSSPSAGSLAFTFAGSQTGCVWGVVEMDNVDTSGTHGSGAIIQAVTGLTATATSHITTLAAFSSADNATYGAFSFIGTSGSILTPGSGFTELADLGYTSPNHHLGVEFRNDNDTTVDMSTAAAANHWAGIAVELKRAA